MAGKQSMVRRAREDTDAVIKAHPVWSGIGPALFALAVAVVSVFVHVNTWPKGLQVALAFFSAGVGGALVLLFALFFVKLVTARRHQLEDRVADLEERLEEQREQVLRLTESQHGDRDRFVPAYQDLRADLRVGAGRIDAAIKSQEMWGGLEPLPVSNWKKHKSTIGGHPYAQEDGIYDDCAEAFVHMERLNGVRFRRRPVREDDDLAKARQVVGRACDKLTAVINRASPAQP